MRTILIILLLIPSVVNAEFSRSDFFQPLSKKDIYLQIGFTTLACIDWYMTKKIEEGHNENCPEIENETNYKCGKEENPFFSDYPSQEEIDTKIFLGIAGHAFITYMLPETYRKYWQAFFIAIEIDAINHNSKSDVVSININILY